MKHFLQEGRHPLLNSRTTTFSIVKDAQSTSDRQLCRVTTNELLNCSRRNPKRSAKCVLSHFDIVIVYCTCGHLLRKGRGENLKFIKYTMDFLSILEYVIKKGRFHRHQYNEKRGRQGTFHGTSWRSARRSFSKVSMIDSHEMKHSAIKWLRMLETKMFVNKWMFLRTKSMFTHHLTPQEYDHFKSNWRLTSNRTGSNIVPVEHRLDFKEALSILQQLKQKEEKARRNQQWEQSSFSSSWSWQGSWWAVCSNESHHGVEPSTQVDLWHKNLEQIFRAWFSWIHSLCYRWIVYSWRRSFVTDGWCKHHVECHVFAVQECAQNDYRAKWWWIDTVWWQDKDLDTKWEIYKNWLNLIAWQSMTRTPMITSMIAWQALHGAYTTSQRHPTWALALVLSSLCIIRTCIEKSIESIDEFSFLKLYWAWNIDCADTQVRVAHVCELGSCPSKHQQHAKNRKKHDRVLHGDLCGFCWVWNIGSWHTSASCTCVQAWIGPKKMPTSFIET